MTESFLPLLAKGQQTKPASEVQYAECMQECGSKNLEHTRNFIHCLLTED